MKMRKLWLCVAAAACMKQPGPRTDLTALATRPAPLHPLDPLSAGELAAAVETLEAEGKLSEGMLFPILVLNEPPKEDVLELQPGAEIERAAFGVLLDRANNKTFETVVDVVHKKVVSWTEVPGVQPGVLIEEFDSPKEFVAADPRWQAALEKRGIEDFENVQIDTWAAGVLSKDERASGLRLLRVLAYYRGPGGTNPYFRPIEGLVATVDIANKKVLEVVDTGVVPWVKESGDLDPRSIGKQREAPKPLVIDQPEGPSFVIEGHQIRWQKWRFRVGMHPREGAVIYDVRYDDAGRERRILYRAALCEMVVPYGDIDRNWTWRNAFDLGEYGVGRLADSLKAGLDVPANSAFIDATFADDFGKAYVQPKTIAVYERDVGILWKHYDFDAEHDETRRERELVVQFVATVGNYDYGVQWIFTQSAVIQVQAELTGIMLPKGVAEAKSDGKSGTGPERFGRMVHPNVVAPNHQHFFNFRLDLDVDGTKNSFAILDNHAAEAKDNPMLNAFSFQETRPETEKAARSHMNMETHRSWRIFNPDEITSLGHPTAYVLMGGHNSHPYLSPDSEVRKRAGFIDHHVWVTKYKPNEMNAGGYYPNQSDEAAGLPLWTDDDESIVGQDLVLWYTFGVTHNPRPEEWPVMSAHRTSFMLMPDGFFTENPALDVPPPPAEK
jgi:primary-amine oxidase